MRIYKKTFLDDYPLVGMWLLGIFFLLILIGVGIYHANLELNLDKLEKDSGIVEKINRRSKHQKRYIILNNNEKYYILNESSWSTDYLFDEELEIGYSVEIEYVTKRYKEVVSLVVNDEIIYTVDDYKIGFLEYHSFMHILLMIISLIILGFLTVITIVYIKNINDNEKYVEVNKITKNIKDNIWNRLTPKTKVIIGVITFVLGFCYFFLCMGIFGGKGQGISMDNYPIIYITMIFVPLITSIVSIVIVAKNECLIKTTKNKQLQIIKTEKKNVYIEFIASIVIVIIGVISVIYSSFNESIVIEMIVLIFGVIGVIVYSIKIYRKYKDKKYYAKKDFVPKNAYEQLRYDLYKKHVKKGLKNLVNNFDIDFDFDDESKEIEIIFKKELYKIEIIVGKNNKWINVILEEELESKLYEMAEKEVNQNLTIDILEELLYGEEKIKLIFDKNDLSKTYINIANKVIEKEEYIEKLKEFTIF